MASPVWVNPPTSDTSDLGAVTKSVYPWDVMMLRWDSADSLTNPLALNTSFSCLTSKGVHKVLLLKDKTNM